MLSTLRVPLLVGSAAAIVLFAGTPAFADDPGDFVDCSDQPSAAGCVVTVGTPGKPGGGDHGANSNGSSGDGVEPGCRWERAIDQPPPAGAAPGSGAWYSYICGTGGSVLGTAPQWIANPPEAVNPAVLARRASADLPLPTPRIRANPSPNVDLLVRVPVWLWVDPMTWGARTATASVPGVSVTATATPTRVRWEMGAGTTVTCRSAGTPWKAGTNPKAASPDCGYVYRRSSGSAGFSIRATVTWTVTWTGGGATGTLPALTTTDVVTVRVAESQAINGGLG